MNKKLLSVILLLLVTTLCLFGFTACKKGDDNNGDSATKEPSSGLSCTVNSDNETCTITGIGSCADTEVVIPSSIDGYTVTVIGNKAFASCTQITSLIIPNTVKTIGYNAFNGCTGLTEIHIPSSVTSIGARIFNEATNLSTVYYDSSYADKDNPFLNLAHITKIVFNCETIKQYMYNGAYNAEIVIGDKVTTIGDNAFRDYSNLTNIIIPDSVTSIGNSAFSGCSGLTSVTFGNNVTSIGNSAFV